MIKRKVKAKSKTNVKRKSSKTTKAIRKGTTSKVVPNKAKTCKCKTTKTAPKKTNLNAVRKAKKKKTVSTPSKNSVKSTSRRRKTTTKRGASKTRRKSKTQARKGASESEKNNRNKVEDRDEFRTNKSSGHPAYIYAKVGDEYKYIGITHASITNKISNIELSKNPNPKDNKKAYAIPKARVDKTRKFKNQTKKGWQLSEMDKEKLKPNLK